MDLSPGMGNYVSTGEAACLCAVSRHSVLRAVRRGDLAPAFYTAAGHLRFRARDVEAFATKLAAARSTAAGCARKPGQLQSQRREDRDDAPPADNIDEVADRSNADKPLHQAIFEESLSMMLTIDPADGRIVNANRAACEFYGYRHEELTSMHIGDLNCLSPQVIAAEMERARAQKCHHFRFKHQLASGEQRDVDVYSSPIRAGNRQLLASVIHDVTEHRQTLHALALATDLVRTLSSAVEQSPVCVVITDPTGAIEYANLKLYQVTGYGPDEVIGQNPRILKSGLTPPETYAGLWSALTAGNTWNGAFINRKKNGELYWEQAFVGPIRDDSGVTTHFVAVKEDITERRRVSEAQRQLAAIVEASHDAIFACTLDGVITSWNRGAEHLYGYGAAEAIGQSVRFLTPPEYIGELMAIASKARQGEPVADYETQRVRKDGSPVSVSITVAPIHDERGDLSGAAVVARDISLRKAAEAALRRSEVEFRTLVEQAPVGAFILDADGRFEIVNEAFAELFAYGRDELIGQHLGIMFRPCEQESLRAWYAERLRTGAKVQQEYEMVGKDGRLLTVLAGSIQIAADAVGRIRRASFVTDITVQKRTEHWLAHVAHHDALTGLPNRVLFADRLEQALRAVSRDRRHLTVLVIDLDGFKAVNDSLGHAAGDQLLRAAAGCFLRAVRESDTVARLGGDEFAVLLPGAEVLGAIRVAGKIRAGLAVPVRLREGVVQVDASIGIAVYPDHGEDAESLTRNADRAMYMAKDAGGGHFVHGTHR